MGVPFGFEIDDSGEFLVVVKPGIFRQNQSVHNMISYVRFKIVFEYYVTTKHGAQDVRTYNCSKGCDLNNVVFWQDFILVLFFRGQVGCRVYDPYLPEIACGGAVGIRIHQWCFWPCFVCSGDYMSGCISQCVAKYDAFFQAPRRRH